MKMIMKICFVLMLGFFLLTFLMINAGSNVGSSNDDEWWKNTDEYARCYGKITQVHKSNGLHDRNRTKSIKIKEEMCKTAVTSSTGEGSYWLK
jgi:hypothetical protein